MAIFMAFAGIIAPGGKYKKYMEMALGTILIIVTIRPIIAVINGGENVLTGNKALNILEIDGYAELELEKGETIQNDILQRSVSETLKTRTDEVTAQFGARVTDFEARLEQGNLTGIDMSVEPSAPPSNYDRFIYVEPIETRGARDAEATETLDIKNIKNAVSDFYNLPLDNINITVRRN
jgi:hypothetical protein